MIKLSIPEQLKQFVRTMQGVLFPTLEQELGPLTPKHQQIVAVLNLIDIDALVPAGSKGVGRPPRNRRAIASAFVAKAVFNMSTTRQLLDRLEVDVCLRRICGWEGRGEIPDETVFSRAFAEFAKTELAQRLHATLIEATQKDRLIGHISRDATEIEAREKPQRPPAVPVAQEPEKPQRKRGRRKNNEPPPLPEPTRMEQQAVLAKQDSTTIEQMLEGLPLDCNVGSKKNSKGYKETWIGYKLHIDVADGQIPISLILTSASLHDSQVAIPLAFSTAQRVTHLYELMDSAYDAQPIHQFSRDLGHIPLIDANPRRDQARKQELLDEQRRRKLLNHSSAEDIRYNERTTVERVNARLKDEFGGRMVRVRGNAKVPSDVRHRRSGCGPDTAPRRYVGCCSRIRKSTEINSHPQSRRARKRQTSSLHLSSNRATRLTYGKSRFVGANFFRLSGFFVAHANFASASIGWRKD